MSDIGAGLKAALLEQGFSAAAGLIPHLRNGFVLVGGCALLSLGGNRWTEDIDVAVTVPALHAFYAAAGLDPRFKKEGLESWRYTSSSGIIVPVEFLAQGGDFAPVIKSAREITPGAAGGGLRAGLGELAVMKARTWIARYEEKVL